MMRTKWMRLAVRDPSDILRWAGTQNCRDLGDFRHRVIGGREFVSFRMVPRYPIEIGTRDIVVLAHVKPGLRQNLLAAIARFGRMTARRAAAFRPRSAPAPTAELYQLAAARSSYR